MSERPAVAGILGGIGLLILAEAGVNHSEAPVFAYVLGGALVVLGVAALVDFPALLEGREDSRPAERWVIGQRDIPAWEQLAGFSLAVSGLIGVVGAFWWGLGALGVGLGLWLLMAAMYVQAWRLPGVLWRRTAPLMTLPHQLAQLAVTVAAAMLAGFLGAGWVVVVILVAACALVALAAGAEGREVERRRRGRYELPGVRING